MTKRGYHSRLTWVTALFVMGAALVAPAALVAAEYAFVLSTDYWSTAYYSTIEVLPPRTTAADIATCSTDPVVHYDSNDGIVFIVNRYLADNIQIVDPSLNFATVGQYSVGNGSNPHDIRLASSDKAYVTRFEWTTLLIVHPYTGDSLGSIDLSPLADADGIPEMDRMEIVDGKLFVTLNSINHTTWLPDGPGKIAVIDTGADTLIDCDPLTPGIQPIVMELPNPYSELRYDPYRQELIVGCLSAWGDLEGGVEAIDPFTLESKGVIITEEQIGGDISDVLLVPGHKGFAVVMDTMPWPDNYARLVAFDAVTAQVLDTLYQQSSGMGSSLANIEMNQQAELYLCDRDATQPRVRIYDAVAHSLIAAMDVGVPPYDLEFVQQPTTDVALETHPAPWKGFALHQNQPNPFNPCTKITYTIHPELGLSHVRLSVFDVRGRFIRTLVDEGKPAGTYGTQWDGKNASGRIVTSGVYSYQLSINGATETRTMLLIR